MISHDGLEAIGEVNRLLLPIYAAGVEAGREDVLGRLSRALEDSQGFDDLERRIGLLLRSEPLVEPVPHSDDP